MFCWLVYSEVLVRLVIASRGRGHWTFLGCGDSLMFCWLVCSEVLVRLVIASHGRGHWTFLCFSYYLAQSSVLWKPIHPAQIISPKPVSVTDSSIPYSGKLSREKAFATCWKIRFLRRKPSGIALLLPHQRMPRPQISWRKLSQMATKPQNSPKFSTLKVSHYMVFQLYQFFISCIK